MNNKLSYFIESISRKLVLLQDGKLNKEQTELIDEMLDTDIVEIQSLIRRAKSLTTKQIKALL